MGINDAKEWNTKDLKTWSAGAAAHRYAFVRGHRHADPGVRLVCIRNRAIEASVHILATIDEHDLRAQLSVPPRHPARRRLLPFPVRDATLERALRRVLWAPEPQRHRSSPSTPRFAPPFIILALVSILLRLCPLFLCARPPYFPSIADCVSLVLAPSPRSFSFAHHTHRSSVHLHSYSALLFPSVLFPSPLRSLFTSMYDADALSSPPFGTTGLPPLLSNTASSSVSTIRDHGVHQALSHRMSIAPLCTKARLKPRRSTTRSRTCGLHHQSFLGAPLLTPARAK
ncbi:hypothetical protein B0H19DRAFT_1274992 [Mycena capillaripes]|nr:hypothetical protein B0H19DRAFT_1274992 [Mycena capillaripes]